MLRVTVTRMDTNFAPYAPPSAVLNVIRHYRSRDVPEKVTITNLQQIGVTEALANRTMAALRFLDLIRDDETTTDQFRALRFASDDEYQQVLGGILDAAYKNVLDHVDLETADDKALNNAFIPYSPGGQRPRMITLFLALAQEAGRKIAAPAKASAPRSAAPKSLKPKGRPEDGGKRHQYKSGGDGGPDHSGQSGAGVVAFGVTDSDLAALPDDEFDSVWAALGKLARARAKAARPEQAALREDAEE